MAKELAAIKASAGWNAYYEAYQRVYGQICQARWALGRASFANQLHHTAIPDASGVTLGSARWAAYSQPSTPTLLAFLEVFATLVEGEPGRVRSNRHLFFVPDGQPARDDAKRALRGVSERLDFWVGSFDDALKTDLHLSVIDSINVMFSGERQIVDLRELSKVSPFEAVKLAKRQIDATRFEALSSIVPPSIRRLHAVSSILLAGVRANLNLEEFLSLEEQDISIAAFVAIDRARASGWTDPELKNLIDLMTRVPPRTRQYVVAPGDILTRLVREFYEQPFETLWPIIKLLNPQIRDPNIIRIGERIAFPLVARE